MNYRMILMQIVALLLLFTVTATAAEATKTAPSAYTLGEVLVTAEKLDDYIKNYPQDVNVVERSEIVKRNHSTLEEVLKTMPGVEVYPTSGMGSRISIRGSGKSGGVLILLNGRPLNSNQAGSMDLNAIPVEIIESVTVFKPPVPVWLGPGGSDGAINIITREIKPSGKGEKSSSTIKAAGGSYGQIQAGAGQVLKLGDGNLLLSGNYNHRDGKRDNSDRNDGNAAVNWNRSGTNGNKYEVNGRYYQAEYGVPGPTDNVTPDARQQYRKGSLDGRMVGALMESGTYTLNMYGDLVNLKERSQYGYTATLDDRKIGLKLDTCWAHGDGAWELRVGGMSEFNDFDHTLAGKHERVRNGLNAQFDKRFGNFTASIGARADITNDFGFNPGGLLGLGWGVNEKTLVKVRVGYTTNVPTFEQLYQSTHGSIDQSRGNPDLNGEKVLSSDVSVEYKFAKEKLVQATLFRVDTWDLITAERGADQIYRPINISGAERQGVELTGKYGWESGLVSDLSFIWQNSKDNDTGKKLPYTPDIKVKMTLQYTVPKLKTRLEGSLRYEGERYSQAQNLPEQKMNDYVTLDIRATQPLTCKTVKADLYVKVDNLFNAAYQSHRGYPDDGIRALGGVQMRF